MKKILVSFFIFINFLYSVEIDEHKVDLYYANGIMMQETKKQAERTWEKRVCLVPPVLWCNA